MVRYRVKPERVLEHEALIHAVFAALNSSAPDGLRYGAFKQPDGVSFVHIAFVAAGNPLQALPAFNAFTERLKERCDEMPVTVELTSVGLFGL